MKDFLDRVHKGVVGSGADLSKETPSAREHRAPPSGNATPLPAGSPTAVTAEPVVKRKSFAFTRTTEATEPASSPTGKASPGVAPELLHGEDNTAAARSPALLPGSDGEHALQLKYASRDRAQSFYGKQVLSFLAPKMREFISKQEMMVVATADRHGECDCTTKFGEPGFIRSLNEKYVVYPEFRGNGVFANLGNLSENPHVALLILDLYRDSIGLHINGKARIIENAELANYADMLPQDMRDELIKDGKRQPERWIMVEVEEAYVQCSKHLPLVQKVDRKVDWGTDNAAAKKVDYFELQGIPLYDRVGGDKAMEIVVDIFYRKVLQDELVSRFFEDVNMEGQRLKQKSFLSMAFGGPYQYTKLDMRRAHGRLVTDMGLTDEHFDQVVVLLRETLEEAGVAAKEVDEMLEVLGSMRDDVLSR